MSNMTTSPRTFHIFSVTTKKNYMLSPRPLAPEAPPSTRAAHLTHGVVTTRNARAALVVIEVVAIAPALRAFGLGLTFGPWTYFTWWVRTAGLTLALARMHRTRERPALETAFALLNVPLALAVGRDNRSDLDGTHGLRLTVVEDVWVHIVAPVGQWWDYARLQTSEPRGGLTVLALLLASYAAYALFVAVAVSARLLDGFPYAGWMNGDAVVTGATLAAALLFGAVVCCVQRPLQVHEWRALIRW